MDGFTDSELWDHLDEAEGEVRIEVLMELADRSYRVGEYGKAAELSAQRRRLQVAGTAQTHARLEALRIAWADRLALLGDPEHAAVPVAKLLSADYARATADRVRQAVKEGKVLAHAATTRDHTGTINLSVVDRDGNLAAITLTLLIVTFIGESVREAFDPKQYAKYE